MMPDHFPFTSWIAPPLSPPCGFRAFFPPPSSFVAPAPLLRVPLQRPRCDLPIVSRPRGPLSFLSTSCLSPHSAVFYNSFAQLLSSHPGEVPPTIWPSQPSLGTEHSSYSRYKFLLASLVWQSLPYTTAGLTRSFRVARLLYGVLAVLSQGFCNQLFVPIRSQEDGRFPFLQGIQLATFFLVFRFAILTLSLQWSFVLGSRSRFSSNSWIFSFGRRAHGLAPVILTSCLFCSSSSFWAILNTAIFLILRAPPHESKISFSPSLLHVCRSRQRSSCRR